MIGNSDPHNQTALDVLTRILSQSGCDYGADKETIFKHLQGKLVNLEMPYFLGEPIKRNNQKLLPVHEKALGFGLTVSKLRDYGITPEIPEQITGSKEAAFYITPTDLERFKDLLVVAERNRINHLEYDGLNYNRKGQLISNPKNHYEEFAETVISEGLFNTLKSKSGVLLGSVPNVVGHDDEGFGAYVSIQLNQNDPAKKIGEWLKNCGFCEGYTVESNELRIEGSLEELITKILSPKMQDHNQHFLAARDHYNKKRPRVGAGAEFIDPAIPEDGGLVRVPPEDAPPSNADLATLVTRKPGAPGENVTGHITPNRNGPGTGLPGQG